MVELKSAIYKLTSSDIEAVYLEISDSEVLFRNQSNEIVQVCLFNDILGLDCSNQSMYLHTFSKQIYKLGMCRKTVLK